MDSPDCNAASRLAAADPAAREHTADFLHRALDLGLAFKQRPEIFGNRMPSKRIRDMLVEELSEESSTPDATLEFFVDCVLPLCKNEASPRFLGFGDTGDDLPSIAGGVLSMLTQQNLINQSFDSPSATFIEVTVLRWLRRLLGFVNPPVPEIATVWDVGGVIGHRALQCEERDDVDRRGRAHF